MKTKLTRQSIFEIWFVLKNEIKEEMKLDKRFDYARNRTLDFITPEVSQLIKARETGVVKFKEFEEKRKEIINSYNITEGEKLSDELEKELNGKLTVLVNEYEDAIDSREKEVQIYNELIQEEIDIDICQCSFRYIPDEVSSEFTKVIRPMIKETDEEIEAILNE